MKKVRTSTASTVLALLLALALASCNGDNGINGDAGQQGAPPVFFVTGVSLNKPTTSLAAGGQEQLYATVQPSGANQSVTWSSSSGDIATVSASGLVIGISEGAATITATTQDGGHAASCAVTVTTVAATGVSLNKSTLSLVETNTGQLTATVQPSNATNKAVTWASSDDAIASVSASGFVKGVKAGTATITATTQDGGKTATCAVTVTIKPPESGDGETKIWLLTAFPVGVTKKAAVDVRYEAVSARSASISWVSYSINGGAHEYVYLAGGGGITPKGTLGSARVMLAPGENRIAFHAKDSAGGEARCDVPGSPVYDFGTLPDYDGVALDNTSGEEEGARHVTDRIVVVADPGTTEAQVAQAATALGGAVVAQVNPLGMYWVQFPGYRSEAQLRSSCAKLLDGHPGLFLSASLDSMLPPEKSELEEAQTLEPNEIGGDPKYPQLAWIAALPSTKVSSGVTVATDAPTNDPAWARGHLWRLAWMNVPAVWEAYSGKLHDTKMGVVDVDFFANHEDLRIPTANVVGNSNYGGHGAAVTGVIAAAHGNGKGFTGVMDIARGSIYGYKASSNYGIISGLAWTVAHGAKVVNFSLLCGGPDIYTRAMRNLLASGYDFMVVQCAGNDAVSATKAGIFTSIADIELRRRIVVAGAISRGGAMASFSNYGTVVDVVAPGENIFTCGDGGSSSYGLWYGTSFSAPHIAGLAGLVWSANPGLTGPQVKQIIVDSAREFGVPITDTRSGMPRLTYYMPDAKAAVNMAMGLQSVKATGVTVSPSAISISVGETQALDAAVLPSDATNKYVVWSSSSSAIATVSASGLVKGVKPGTVDISVGFPGGKSAKCRVTVMPVLAMGVSLSKASASVSVGGQEQLTATVQPGTATNKAVAWASSDSSVATVSSSGLVKGVRAGAATITATTQDGGHAASCAVTVTAVAATGVSLNKSALSLVEANTGQLTATVQPGTATNKAVAWASSDNSVATVSSSGLVKGVRAGAATITATTQDGGKTATCAVTVEPATSAILSTATLAAANSYSLVIVADGSLWAFGQNNYGQLGDGSKTNRKSPVRADTVNDWAAVSAGVEHTVAIKTNGSLWAWGRNDNNGQLGNGTHTNQNSPIRVGTANDWVAVSAGAYHTLAIKSDGSLWAWGQNIYGQLGDGTTTSLNTPFQVGADKDWTAVSAGTYHTLAIKSDGSLWAWGQNIYGQLGDGTKTSRSTPVQVGADKNWAKVSAGASHTLAIKSDGSLWAWGNNDYWGQLGNGTYQNQSLPARVDGANDWAAVTTAAGSSSQVHTLAIKSDGSLWAWGGNDYGQLGLGDYGLSAKRNTPMRVGTGNDWAAVMVGDLHTLALKSDGSLWVWGSNNYGELGVVTASTTNPVPVRVGAGIWF